MVLGMGFLFWYYRYGIRLYLLHWYFNLVWINHYFSLPLLIKTIFSPWKRLIIKEKRSGFNITKIVEDATFNLVSRGIGAVVRFSLFWAGAFILLLYFFAGAVGFIIWLIFPPLGFLEFTNYNKKTRPFIDELFKRIKNSKDNQIKVLSESEPGRFLAEHLNLNVSDLISGVSTKETDLNKLIPQNFEELVKYFVDFSFWTDDFLRKNGLKKEDLVWAASWADIDRVLRFGNDEDQPNLGRPGIGLEIVFGYTPLLDKYSIDLGLPQSFYHHLIGRENIVNRMERVLTAGSNVMLVGDPGVGRKTVVLEFAHRAANGVLGEKMSYRRVMEFDYNYFLSGTFDLNTKKSNIADLLNEASSAGNIILVIRDIHRLTNPDVEGFDLTDTFEQYLENKELKIIAIESRSEYERFIAPNLRLRKFFENVEVTPPSKEDAMRILINAAENWERKKRITITVPALRRILDLSDMYITETPFPEKALEILDQLVIYKEKDEKPVVTVDSVNIVLAEKTGIVLSGITPEQKLKLERIEEVIHERLINQETAVSLIAKSLRSRSVGVKGENRPVGSFLFLGPTGVGKTQTAKILARVYYGDEKNILRFDMAEYAGGEGVERLIGSINSNKPGVLTTEIKNHPASLLLLDEIEKSSDDIFNLFLTLLDEGYISDTFDRRVSCRNLFVIATSNAGAEFVRQLVTKGVKGNDLQTAVLDYIQKEGIFSPEFLNRFDGVVVFEPLVNEHLLKVAKVLLDELAVRLKEKGIMLEIDYDLTQKLALDGYQPEFGARPMRRIVDLELGDLVSRAILSGSIKEGDKIKIIPGKAKNEYSWQKILPYGKESKSKDP